jgi:hypothetical protein
VAGSIGCAALAGAPGNMVEYGVGTPTSQWSLGGFAKAGDWRGNSFDPATPVLMADGSAKPDSRRGPHVLFGRRNRPGPRPQL